MDMLDLKDALRSTQSRAIGALDKEANKSDVSADASAEEIIEFIFSKPFNIKLNADDIKKIATLTHFTDKSGIEWAIKSTDTHSLNDPINIIASNMKSGQKRRNYEYSFRKFYFLRKRAYIKLERIFTFNNSTIKFVHHHDIRTNVLTFHGKPTDMSKYTKDYAR